MSTDKAHSIWCGERNGELENRKDKNPYFIGYEVAAAKISFMKYIFSLGPLTKNSSSEIKHMGLCSFPRGSFKAECSALFLCTF